MSACGNIVFYIHAGSLIEVQFNYVAATELAHMFAFPKLVVHHLSLDDVIGFTGLNPLDNRLLRLEQSFALAQVDVDSFDILPTLVARAGYTNCSREHFTTSQILWEAAPSGSFSLSREAENATNSLLVTCKLLHFTLGYYSARQVGNCAFVADERARCAGMDFIRYVRQSFWSAYATQQLSDTIVTTMIEADAVLAWGQEGEESGAIPAVETLRSWRTMLENVRQLEILSHELASARKELAQLASVLPGSPLALAPSQMSVPSRWVFLPELMACAFTSIPSLREQQYRINIALNDFRRTTAQLLPDLSLLAEPNFDADAFLLNNSWNQFGLTAGWNLMRLITGPQRINLCERGVEVERARARAVHIAVLTQTHIAYRVFHFACAQFQRARDLAWIDQQLAQRSRAREETSVVSQAEHIVVETSALISQLRVYDACSELMAAYSAVLSIIGVDADLRQMLEEDQQDRQQAVENLQTAEGDMALETAGLGDISSKEARLQRDLASATRARDRAGAARDGDLVHRDEVQALAAAAYPHGAFAARAATWLANAETDLGHRERDLAAATQALDALTQELSALAVARSTAMDQRVLAQTAPQTAEQQSRQLTMTRRFWLGLALCLAPFAQAMAQDLPVLGRVLPLQEAVISAPRPGHLVELRVEMADRVAAGEVIARFSCEIEQAQHEAALAASRSLELQYRSQQQLREFASTSALEVEIALAEWQRSLAQAKIHASATAQCNLVAPFDGVISATSVRNFEHVGAGQEILRIIDSSQTFFEFLAPLPWLSERAIGDRINLYFEAIDREVSATIDRIAPDVDAVSQTVRMRAIIEEAATAIPVGMPGMVRRETDGQAR